MGFDPRQRAADVRHEYRPLYAEKRCKHCGFWRGQHLPASMPYADLRLDVNMLCPTKHFEPDSVDEAAARIVAAINLLQDNGYVIGTVIAPDEYWCPSCGEIHNSVGKMLGKSVVICPKGSGQLHII
jgi:hypothetical protein